MIDIDISKTNCQADHEFTTDMHWRRATSEPTETGRYLVYYREVSDGSYLPEFDRNSIRIMRYHVDFGWRYPVFVPRKADRCITTKEVLYWMPLPKEPMTDGTDATRRSNAPGSADTENVQATQS